MRTCTICRSEHVRAINGALRAGVPERTIARRWGVGRSSVHRHRRHVWKLRVYPHPAVVRHRASKIPNGGLRVVPLRLAEANALVERWHRHHRPAVGMRFCMGAVDAAGEMHGAAICGRPVAKDTDDREVLEVARLVTDGTRNACSILYAAAARAAKAMGYSRIQTFLLESEPGTSLLASGWAIDGMTEHTGGHTRGGHREHTRVVKQKWARDL